jgi:hypothetical protein
MNKKLLRLCLMTIFAITALYSGPSVVSASELPVCTVDQVLCSDPWVNCCCGSWYACIDPLWSCADFCR